MIFETIIKKIQSAEGNYCRGAGDIYISPLNMEKFAIYIEDCDDVQSILITPYLINVKDGALYELHYYEFELEILNISKSYFVEYAESNVLPKEITDNIKPKAMIAKNDKGFLIGALQNYLKSIAGMAFEQDRNSNKMLEKANLFYQIF